MLRKLNMFKETMLPNILTYVIRIFQYSLVNFFLKLFMYFYNYLNVEYSGQQNNFVIILIINLGNITLRDFMHKHCNCCVIKVTYYHAYIYLSRPIEVLLSGLPDFLVIMQSTLCSLQICVGLVRYNKYLKQKGPTI